MGIFVLLISLFIPKLDEFDECMFFAVPKVLAYQMPEIAMLKNKLVLGTKQHFIKMVLCSCAVFGREEGVQFTGFGGS